MLSVLRNRLGLPGLISVIALVLAMTGGAWAASKYIITSTKQIKPSVLSSLKGKTGPAGPAGSNGTNGANGAPGANGVSVTNTKLEPGEGGCAQGGAQFKVGSGTATVACNGEPGEPGEEGEPGAEGSPWVVGSVPAGKELRGTWALNANAAGSEAVYTALTTGVPLGNPVSLVLRGPATLGTLECAGTAENPLPPTNEGNPVNGVICVYTGASTNLEAGAVKKVAFSKGGVVVQMTTTGAGVANGFGSWSMYAP